MSSDVLCPSAPSAAVDAASGKDELPCPSLPPRPTPLQRGVQELLHGVAWDQPIVIAISGHIRAGKSLLTNTLAETIFSHEFEALLLANLRRLERNEAGYLRGLRGLADGATSLDAAARLKVLFDVYSRPSEDFDRRTLRPAYRDQPLGRSFVLSQDFWNKSRGPPERLLVHALANEIDAAQRVFAETRRPPIVLVEGYRLLSEKHKRRRLLARVDYVVFLCSNKETVLKRRPKTSADKDLEAWDQDVQFVEELGRWLPCLSKLSMDGAVDGSCGWQEVEVPVDRIPLRSDADAQSHVGDQQDSSKNIPFLITNAMGLTGNPLQQDADDTAMQILQRVVEDIRERQVRQSVDSRI